MQSVCGHDKIRCEYLLTFNSSSSSANRRSNILRSWCQRNVREGGWVVGWVGGRQEVIKRRRRRTTKVEWKQVRKWFEWGGERREPQQTAGVAVVRQTKLRKQQHVKSWEEKHYLSLQIQHGWTVTEALLSLLDATNAQCYYHHHNSSIKQPREGLCAKNDMMNITVTTCNVVVCSDKLYF